MNERLEDDPRLRTILAFATLDPDNMSYEVMALTGIPAVGLLKFDPSTVRIV